MKFFIILSVPCVIVSLLLLFGLFDQITWVMLAALLIILWLLLGYHQVWNGALKRVVRAKVLPSMDVREYQQTRYVLVGSGLRCIIGDSVWTIPFEKILSFVPFDDMFVIYCMNKKSGREESLILPYDSFKDEEDMKGFVYAFESNWKSWHERNGIEGD